MKHWFAQLAFGKKIQLLINAISVGVLLLAVLAIGLGFYGEFKRNLEDRVIQKSRLLADAASVGVIFDQTESVSMLLRSLAVDNGVVEAIVYKKLGASRYEYFAHYRHESLSKKTANDYAYDMGPQQEWYRNAFILRLPMLVDGEEIGRLVLVENDNYLRVFVQNILIYLIPILLTSMFLIWLISRRVQFWVAKPLRELTVAVNEVAYKQNYQMEVRINSDDELGELGGAFNVMLNKLAENDEYRVKKELEIIQLNADLEDKVFERTRELKKSLDDLKHTQQQLVEQEKMASLGELVAGVAHEINTPIGVGITAVSHLDNTVQRLRESFIAGTLTKQQFTDLLSGVNESSDILAANLKRAADLVKAFKSVAVDQTSAEARLFNLNDYIKDVLTSLRPKLKRVSHQVIMEVDENIDLYCDPGIISQIFTNLILNSLNHAFSDADEGKMEIKAEADEKNIHLTYCDDGEGIEPDLLPRLFDPFVTTKRGQGGSGLGTHIIYNLVTQGLGGTIHCTSELGKGACFDIVIPKQRITPSSMS
ncbi:HAMP domain-containing protein [Bermanella marisrubri]|uniref:histidine kinase n=1 Tax=Bermanella marisrubri TaxID=207949 RepID=Q1MZK6_9GAMM|nr:ATP-binding protein [Bermanella marisrubri]EAT11405.1 Signal transduction histidine kinase (contains HAMP domain) [Oceanobacter sp. RED65] [Bermanella marisrubri]QIZ85596.1 HAMP domain-containing protein [Bermanella marisrubri]